MAEMKSIEVVGLGKTVDNGGEPLTILQDISFAVMPGETVAIVGASGSGKSTLLGLLAGLDLPTTGEVRLDGQALGALDEDARAVLRGRLIGFVFQSFQLLPSLTALENVMLPLELAGNGEARALARQWLEQVGLGHRLRHYPKHLSGGEQQRVALARAFAPDPRLVLADEPTGNLDASTGHQVIEMMFDLNARQGTTLILVTHDEEIAARCGRVPRTPARRPLRPRTAFLPASPTASPPMACGGSFRCFFASSGICRRWTCSATAPSGAASSSPCCSPLLAAGTRCRLLLDNLSSWPGWFWRPCSSAATG